MRKDVRLISIAVAGTLACSAPDLGPGDFVPRPGALPAVTTDARICTLARVEDGYAADGVRRTGPDSTTHSFVGSAFTSGGPADCARAARGPIPDRARTM